MSLVQFSDNAAVRFNLNQYRRREDVLQNVQMMPYTRGRTNTAAALQLLRTQVFTSANGDRFEVPNYAVLITDGESTVNPDQTLPEAVKVLIV